MEDMSHTVVIEDSSLLLPMALVLPLFILFRILKHFKTSSKSLQLPPGPKPWPLVGNLFHMGNMPHVTLSNFAKTYGPLIYVRLGTQPVVVASTAAAAAEILKTNDRVLSARYVPHVMPIERSELNKLSMGWSLECGEGWKNLRTVCRNELFSGKALESQAWIREKKVMDLVNFINGRKGEAVNIGDIVFTSVYNILGNILLSKDIFSWENDGGEMKLLVRAVMEGAGVPNISDLYPFLSGLDLQGLKKKSKKLGAKINATWSATIKERRATKQCGLSRNSTDRDFLDVLIENSFTDDGINQLLQELFSAGRDSNSTTVEWAMAELVKSPESMKNVIEELEREIKDDVLKESQLPKLTYLQACVKETLRLHPAAPLMLPHRAQESCEVMNYSILKDCQVLVNVWAIGHDPMYWEEPLKFKPDRFLNSSVDFKGTDFEFLPFGAGRRICPGLPMAAKQVPLILASLIHFFDWSLPHGVDPQTLDMSEKFGMTLMKKQPLLLIPSPRFTK